MTFESGRQIWQTPVRVWFDLCEADVAGDRLLCPRRAMAKYWRAASAQLSSKVSNGVVTLLISDASFTGERAFSWSFPTSACFLNLWWKSQPISGFWAVSKHL